MSARPVTEHQVHCSRSLQPDSVRGLLAGGSAILAFVVLGLFGWAGTAQIAGAVIAQGSIVVQSSAKKVQHPTGGIVSEIVVRDGSRVNAGDLLLRLDETTTRTALQLVSRQLDEIAVRKARLAAELATADELTFPSVLMSRLAEPEIRTMLDSERSLFVARKAGLDGQQAQSSERISQLRQQIEGLSKQQQAKLTEIALIAEELARLEMLYEQKLTPVTRVIALKRDATRLEGERGNLVAAIAEARGRIAETELQLLQFERDFRTEALKELRELQAKEVDLRERRVAAVDQLQRVDIRAPSGGIVHQLSAQTVGGVVTSGEILMLIVPSTDELEIEARIAPQDIDQVQEGTAALVRLTAFSQRTTPEFDAVVTRMSPDLTRDQKTNAPYYVARVRLNDGAGRLLGGLALLPGMPAEVYMKTAERTALSYMMKPMTDQFARAFRER